MNPMEKKQGSTLVEVYIHFRTFTRIEIGSTWEMRVLTVSLAMILFLTLTITLISPSSPSVLEGTGLRGLTTGYFDLPVNCMPLIVSPPLFMYCVRRDCSNVSIEGKCNHGLDFAGIDFCDGINKDEEGRPLHDEALAK